MLFCVSFVQPVKAKSNLFATYLHLSVTEEIFLQSEKQNFISVTLFGIVGACVRFVQLEKQKLISVTLFGIVGACVRFAQ